VLLRRVSQAPVPAPPGKPESALQVCLSLQGHKLHRLRGRLALQPQERARPGSPSASTLGRRCLREAQRDCARTYAQAAECTRIRSSRPGSLRRAHPSSAGPGLLPGVLHASATGRPFTTRPAARPSSSSRLARCPSSSVTARTWCVTAAKPAQQSPCMELSSPAPARLARTACMPNVPVALRSRARVTCKRAGRSQVARALRAASSSSHATRRSQKSTPAKALWSCQKGVRCTTGDAIRRASSATGRRNAPQAAIPQRRSVRPDCAKRLVSTRWRDNVRVRQLPSYIISALPHRE